MVILFIGIVLVLVGLMFVNQKMNTARLSLEPISGKVKEHHQGWSFKETPWSTLQGQEINMTGNIIITSNGILAMSWDDFLKSKIYTEIPGKAYETKSKTPVYGSWAAAIRPRKGYLKEFLTRTPQAAAIMAMADIDIFISDLIAKEEIEDIIGKKTLISKRVSKEVFGGEDTISPFEKTYGIEMFDPRLIDLNLGKRSLDATEKLFESKKFKESVDNMMKGNEMTEEQAINAVLHSTGMAKQISYSLAGVPAAIENLADIFKVFITKR